MIQVPCGRVHTGSDPFPFKRCVEGQLCGNCTALRGLLAACLAAAERIDYVLSACTDDDVIDDIGPVADRLRAAIAAARPAGPTHGKE
jgi:hypothetical protein